MSNGQQWGTVVGGIVGSFFGATQFGMAVGGMIGGAIDPERIHLPSIGDAQQQTAQAGVPRPVVYGLPAPFAGNIIDGEGKARKIQVKDKGKGGPTVYSEKFLLTYAVRICEGPIGGVIRIWRNGEVVYDARTLESMEANYQGGGFVALLTYFREMQAKRAAFQNRVRIYLGDEDQLPDPALEAIHGVGNTPYYRGTAYMVIEDDDVTQMGGAAAQYQFEVSSCVVASSVAGDATTQAEWLMGYNNSEVKPSPDGDDWTQPLVISGGGTTKEFGRNGSEILRLSVTGASAFSADSGTTWAASTPSVSAAGGTPIYSGGYWHVADTSSLCGRSLDGKAFTRVATAHSCWSIVAIGGRLVSAGPSGGPRLNIYHADPAGAAWAFATTAEMPGVTPSDPDMKVGSGVIGIIDRVTVGSDHRALLFKSADAGDTFPTVASPFPDIPVAAGSTSPMLHYDAALGLWVAVFINRIAYGPTLDALTLSTHVLPQLARGIDSDGVKFIICGDGGMLQKSSDGSTWTALTSGVTTTIGDVLALGVVSTPGIELPDSPGHYLQDDGTITGPGGETLDTCLITLRSVVEDIAERCGVPAGKLDATALTDIIPGYLIAGQATGADCLRPTQQMFFYDLPEVDGPIVAVKRGGALAVTITDDDMLASSDDEEETRPQQIEYPAKVSVVTQDPAAEYSPVPQTSIRSSINVNSTSEVTIQSPIPFSGDEAAKKAHIIHKVLFAQAEGRKDFALAEEHGYLVPSDCIGHKGKRWLIETKRYADGENIFECVYDRATAYTSTATGSGVTPPSLPGTGLRGPTQMVAMNLPALRTEDSTPGMYVAVHGLMSDWAGCTLYLSVDGGQTEQAVRPIYNAATMGTLSADLAIAGPSLSVNVYGELESVSLAQIAARANAFAILSGGVAEIGQFQTATLTADGAMVDSYDLTDLTRGLLGTTEAAHLTGDRFVLLDSNVYFVPIDSIHSGKTLIFRAVTLGTDPANNATFSAVYTPTDIIIDGGGA